MALISKTLVLLIALTFLGCGRGLGLVDGGSPSGEEDPATVAVTLVNITPDSSVRGAILTLTGAGFIDGTEVSLGGTPCGSVTVLSSTQLTCEAPRLPAVPTDVTVSRPGNGTTTLAGAFLPITAVYVPSFDGNAIYATLDPESLFIFSLINSDLIDPYVVNSDFSLSHL